MAVIFDWDYPCPRHGRTTADGGLIGAFDVMGERDHGRFRVWALECTPEDGAERCRYVAIRLAPKPGRPLPAPWLVRTDQSRDWRQGPWPARPLSVMDRQP